jgi:hypothetical protein
MRKFLFDRSFDNKKNTQDPSTPETIIAESTQEALRQEAFESGYSRGFQEGVFSANQQKESTIAQNISQILETVTYHSEELDHQKHAIAFSSAQITLNVLERIFPSFQKNLGLLEIKGFVQDLLKNENPQSLKISAHPDICKLLQEKFQSGGEKISITFEGDTQLGFGDFRASWGETGVERIQANLLENCKKLLQQITPPVDPPLEDERSPNDRLNIMQEEDAGASRKRKSIGNAEL